jgi:hypothetical protein
MIHHFRFGPATTVLAPNHASPSSLSRLCFRELFLLFSSLLFSSCCCLVSLPRKPPPQPTSGKQKKARSQLPLTGSITPLPLLMSCLLFQSYYIPHTPSLPAVVPIDIHTPPKIIRMYGFPYVYTIARFPWLSRANLCSITYLHNTLQLQLLPCQNIALRYTRHPQLRCRHNG